MTRQQTRRLMGVDTVHDTPEYHAWEAATQRCTNPRNPGWPSYGARGIEQRFPTFDDFIKAVGPRPSRRHLLDRIDNDGHYERGNVRWATPRQSLANRKAYDRVVIVCKVCGVKEWRRKDATICSPCVKREWAKRNDDHLRKR